MVDVNKQDVTGLYVKIVYDGTGGEEGGQQNNSAQKFGRLRNWLEFVMYHDDGVSNISQEIIKN